VSCILRLDVIHTPPLTTLFIHPHSKNSNHYVPCKVSCNHCRAPLFDEGRNMVLVYPSTMGFERGKVPRDFQPSAHIFYEERVMDVQDGVPKWSKHKGKEGSELMDEVDHEQTEG
jgi:hypothetical protein